MQDWRNDAVTKDVV